MLAGNRKPVSPRRLRWLLLLGSIGLVLSTACSERKVQSAPPAAVPVVVATVEQKTVPLQIQAIGAVEAYSTVSIKSNVSGELTAAYFKEGDDVRKGQLLFTIDKRPFEAELHQAEGNLARDLAQAANAHAQADRYQALFKSGVVAREQADQMVTAANALDAAVRADGAAVENTRVQLQYCTIYSPIDGRTGNLMVKPGNLVKANDNPILLNINQIKPIYVTFTVPEQFLPDIKKYGARRKLEVSANFPSGNASGAVGTLSFIDNAVDQATGTIKLKGTFPNGDRRLWPGQFVNAALTLANQPNAIVVPSQAVQTGQQGDYVFVIKQDMTAEARPVVIAQNLGGRAVIRQGLTAGERVVTDGQLRLVPGNKVEFRAAINSPGTSQASSAMSSQSAVPAQRQERLTNKSAARSGD
jgi:multidrug efflux system membrane fusion protein